MIQRRGLLALMFGSPAIAAGAAGSAALGVPIWDSVVPSRSVQDSVEEASPLERMYRRARDEQDRRLHHRSQRAERMPHHIDGKRSWSLAFKQHVYAREQEAHHNRWNWDGDMTPAQMIAALASIGVKVK